MSTSIYSAAVPSPLRYHDGYPALEDLGLIGDGRTAALVARDGTVVWMCVPRFDSEPLFCSLPAGWQAEADRIDPSTGAFLGNHPQAFSHVGVVSSGLNLARQVGAGADR